MLKIFALASLFLFLSTAYAQQGPIVLVVSNELLSLDAGTTAQCMSISDGGDAEILERRQIPPGAPVIQGQMKLKLTQTQMAQLRHIVFDPKVAALSPFKVPDQLSSSIGHKSVVITADWSGIEKTVGYAELIPPPGVKPTDDDLIGGPAAKQALTPIWGWIAGLKLPDAARLPALADPCGGIAPDKP